MIKEYQNPILSGFYPDPSVCRVGSDYYLVTSTFAFFPGIPVFHSKDLINWKQIGNAIDRPGQICYNENQVSQGLFAPTIRENNGIFYILCTLVKNGGNFIITAKNPAGPWSDPVWLKGAGGIDPSIFFDDDGKVYYIGTDDPPEGEAYPGNKEIFIFEMDLSLLEQGKNPLIGERTGIWRSAMYYAVWSEGPHIYKIKNWYYLLYSEGGTGLDHAVCVARAKNISGPWEGKKSNPVLTHRHLGKYTTIINTGHADIFDDTDGNWWMVLLGSRPFNGVCPLGRETFMVPIKWEDDWPFIATKSGLIDETISIESNNEELAIRNYFDSETCIDHFNDKLPFHWLTLRMPNDEKEKAFSLTERNGALRLFTKAATIREKKHSAFAGRRIRHKNWAFSAGIEYKPGVGDNAGIILHQSEDYQYRLELFLETDNIHLRLVKISGKENEVITKKKLEFYNEIILGAQCEEMKLSFYYGYDKYSLTCLAENIDACILSTEFAGGFVGTITGVFATGNGNDIYNYADILWTEYRSL